MTDNRTLESVLSIGPWQALERLVARIMFFRGLRDVRLIGGSGDKGGDVIAERDGQRWVAQVKFRGAGRIGPDVIDEVLTAQSSYGAVVPVIATNQGFTESALARAAALRHDGIRLQLWDRAWIERRFPLLPEDPPADEREPRDYQLSAIQAILSAYHDPALEGGILLLATGLGKTFTAYIALREILEDGLDRGVLVLAHTNELVYQLERELARLLPRDAIPAIWNGGEKGTLADAPVTVACVNSVAAALDRREGLPRDYQIVIVDEAHHAGSPMYQRVLSELRGEATRFVLGLTATPWRADAVDLEGIVGPILFKMDLVDGMRRGFLSNVDYRLHVDNINWDALRAVTSKTPRALNRQLFIREWDDAVIDTLQATWPAVHAPRCIVFCGTISHAQTVRDRINARGFARAEAIYAADMGRRERDLILSRFHDGELDVVCAVDLFNEGVDVPDVNLIVFQRVTHSRRIFVQQLGRGLRLSPGKESVVVLDFVSDVRRFAAGLELERELTGRKGGPEYVEYGSLVTFHNAAGPDAAAGQFIREWLEDVTAIADAEDDEAVLRFPPDLAR